MQLTFGGLVLKWEPFKWYHGYHVNPRGHSQPPGENHIILELTSINTGYSASYVSFWLQCSCYHRLFGSSSSLSI